MNLIQVALKSVQPSSKREGFATVPDVTFDDIGALKDVRAELSMAILVRFNLLHNVHGKNETILVGINSFSNTLRSFWFRSFTRCTTCWSARMWFVEKLNSFSNELISFFSLFIGKTLLAKAIANESGINFISVKGPELLNVVRKKIRIRKSSQIE